MYQLTTKYPAYRELVDAIIQCDPLVLETAITIQFREFLVEPPCELHTKGMSEGMDAVIIVDGLDECKTTTTQQDIVKLVIASIHQQTMPFPRAFFSRPEPYITLAFSMELAIVIFWWFTLPVSRDTDSNIEAYLRDSFRMICVKYGLPPTVMWPSDKDIHCLVDQSSGLFVYPATIIHYIGQDTGPFGPEEHLKSVLQLGQGNVESDGNPLSALDQLYMLIMEQIPKVVLLDTLSLLAIHLKWDSQALDASIMHYCLVLGFSLTTFHAVTSNLHSILDITKSQTGISLDFSFYHRSFVDFLSTLMRSGPEYCVNRSDNLQRCFNASVNFLYNTSTTDSKHVYLWC